MVRYAFSMIELIFAIVIIGITVISLPMMTQVTAKGADSNLVQEAIFAAAAKLNEAVTYRWDENSLDPATPDALTQIISVSNTDCNSSGQRLGFIPQPKHRKCLNDTTIRPSTTLGTDTGESGPAFYDDLDDVAETGQSLTSNALSASAYKEAYTSTIAISYAAFGVITEASKNIKEINATISETKNGVTSPVTVLRTYSANIGEVDYYKRSFQ